MHEQFGGKINDLKIKLSHIVVIQYNDMMIGQEISDADAGRPKEYWIRKYPNAISIDIVYGTSPRFFVTKTKIL